LDAQSQHNICEKDNSKYYNLINSSDRCVEKNIREQNNRQITNTELYIYRKAKDNKKTTPTFQYTKQKGITFNKTGRPSICGTIKIGDKIYIEVMGLLDTGSGVNLFSEEMKKDIVKKEKV
jgi:hypothetical protein